MKLTFPHLGNTYICVKAFLDDLDVPYIIPPFSNKKALENGTRLSPELACLPLKIIIGNIIQAYEQGADTIFFTGGCGPCRFGYYCEMVSEILKDAGYQMDIITIEWPDKGLPELLRRFRKLTGTPNLFKISKAIKNTAQIARMVDELERLTFKTRPREITKGNTDKIYKSFLHKAAITKGSENIKALIGKTEKELRNISIDTTVKPLRVGIVGEIFTTIDSYTNFQMEAKLGNMGIEVERSVTVSDWIIEHMLKPVLLLPRDLEFVEAAKPYLGAMIGGHARETIGNTVLYAKKGYDGVIQLYPLTCMPEIVAESILPVVERDFDIPVMTLIIDEMTGEAGFMTRLEAFADLLAHKRMEGQRGSYANKMHVNPIKQFGLN